jgi:hypothetical protein
MTTKHTQGEWIIQGKTLIKCNGEQTASVNSMIDEYEANAKLIAAAPDLLNALLAVYKDLEQFSLLPSTERIVKEAINKANK